MGLTLLIHSFKFIHVDLSTPPGSYHVFFINIRPLLKLFPPPPLSGFNFGSLGREHVCFGVFNCKHLDLRLIHAIFIYKISSVWYNQLIRKRQQILMVAYSWQNVIKLGNPSGYHSQFKLIHIYFYKKSCGLRIGQL